MRPIFKIEMLIYQSKVNLDEKFCFVKSLIDPETRKMLVYSKYGNEDSTVHSIEIKIIFLKLTLKTSLPHK